MKKGDAVVVLGRALARVTDVGEHGVAIAYVEDGDTTIIPTDEVATRLRAVATPDAARAAVDNLRSESAADDRDVADRSIAYHRAIKSCDLAVQIRELGSIYRRTEHDYPERQYLERLEKAVYGELAIVLELPRKRLKADMRSAILGEQPPSSLLLPDREKDLQVKQPKQSGYDSQGTFAIDTKLALGELSAQIVLAARTGVWFVYTRGDMDDEDHHLIAVHRDHVANARKLVPVFRGTVNSEGAMVTLCDEVQLDDAEFVASAQMEGSGAHGTHCFKWCLGGDGESRVSTCTEGKHVVLVRIDF